MKNRNKEETLLKVFKFTSQYGNVKKCEVINHGNLARTPAKILKYLVEAKDREVAKIDVVTETMIGSDYFNVRSFDVHLNKLRKIISKVGYKVESTRHNYLRFSEK